MKKRLKQLNQALEVFEYTVDIYPNIYNTVCIDEEDDMLYLSPMGVLLYREIVSCTDLTTISEVIKWMKVTLSLADDEVLFNDIYDLCSDNQHGVLSPYELQLLDTAYYGDFYTRCNVPTLIEHYYPMDDRFEDEYSAGGIYNNMCEVLYKSGTWVLDGTHYVDRMELVIRLAVNWLNRYKVPLDHKWLTKYVPANASPVYNQMKLEQDDG